MNESTKRSADENARVLVRAISEQLANGSKLPKLLTLEGTKVVLTVENGRLNWQAEGGPQIGFW